MAGNQSPIFSRVADIQWCTLTAANTATDGTGTVGTCFTADATNGGMIATVRLRALGTCVTTVARFFVNNGSANSSAANNSLIEEITLPATTASNVASIGAAFDMLNNLVLPPGYKLNVVLGTAVSAGWQFTAIGGKY